MSRKSHHSWAGWEETGERARLFSLSWNEQFVQLFVTCTLSAAIETNNWSKLLVWFVIEQDSRSGACPHIFGKGGPSMSACPHTKSRPFSQNTGVATYNCDKTTVFYYVKKLLDKSLYKTMYEIPLTGNIAPYFLGWPIRFQGGLCHPRPRPGHTTATGQVHLNFWCGNSVA